MGCFNFSIRSGWSSGNGIFSKVGDIRKLDDIIVKKHYPLPLLRSILHGYLNFAIQEDSQKFFHIVSPSGVFLWLNLPFAPPKGPSDFQEFLDTICAGLGYTLGLMDHILTMGHELMEAITILGHQLPAQRLQTLEKHKEALNWFFGPTNTSKVISFLVLVRLNEHLIRYGALAQTLLKIWRGGKNKTLFPKISRDT